MILLPTQELFTFVKNQLARLVWACYSALGCLLGLRVVPPSIPHGREDWSSKGTARDTKLPKAIPPVSFFFFKTISAVPVLWPFHINRRQSLLKSSTVFAMFWTGIAWILYVRLRRISIFAGFGLPTHEQRMSFHLFRLTLFSVAFSRPCCMWLFYFFGHLRMLWF